MRQKHTRALRVLQPSRSAILTAGARPRGADQLGPRLTASPFSSNCYPRRSWRFGGHPRAAPPPPRSLLESLSPLGRGQGEGRRGATPTRQRRGRGASLLAPAADSLTPLPAHWRGTPVPRRNTTRLRSIAAKPSTSGRMVNAPRTEITGHHAESCVGDMTTYVRTLHAAASNKATVSDNRLNLSTAFRSEQIGEKRKNAHPTTATAGSKMSSAAITVAL